MAARKVARVEERYKVKKTHGSEEGLRSRFAEKREETNEAIDLRGILGAPLLPFSSGATKGG